MYLKQNKPVASVDVLCLVLAWLFYPPAPAYPLFFLYNQRVRKTVALIAKKFNELEKIVVGTRRNMNKRMQCTLCICIQVAGR